MHLHGTPADTWNTALDKASGQEAVKTGLQKQQMHVTGFKWS